MAAYLSEMTTPPESVVNLTKDGLKGLADDKLAIIRGWIAEGWVVLPPNWPAIDVEGFDALVAAELARRTHPE